MKIERDQSLKAYNSLALEAQASALAKVNSEAELREAILWARDNQLPLVALGQGSNVVLAGDLSALVVLQQGKAVAILDEDKECVTLRINAGNDWHELVQWSLAQGYYGLENLALIPGTVGAAPIQNIGAYGVEFEQFVVAVHGLQAADGEPLSLDAQACQFAYRDSVFKHALRDKLIITAVDIKLSKTPAVNLTYPALATYLQDVEGQIDPQRVFDAVVNIRRRRLPDPKVEPNAGSFFKNPIIAYERSAYLGLQFPALPRYPQADGGVKLSAAWLIDQCQWKGVKKTGVGVHSAHALVLVNYSSDSGKALLALASEIKDSVSQRFGCELEIEPRVYGSD
ncbi:MAG: UDP-N-acetylmuramate dehydrogenase [Halioglobus sp.]